MQNPTVTSSLVYDDAHRALEWATDVLGLTVKSVYKSPNGGIAFAELVWRSGVIFISDRPPADNPWAKVGIASLALVAADETEVAQA